MEFITALFLALLIVGAFPFFLATCGIMLVVFNLLGIAWSWKVVLVVYCVMFLINLATDHKEIVIK